MWAVSSGLYFDVTFDTWDGGTTLGGGFSYHRTQYVAGGVACQ
jgi:hypothetical protein